MIDLPATDQPRDTPQGATPPVNAAVRSTWVSVVVNLTLASLQIAIGLIARSQGLVADGIHSLSDLISDFIVLLAGYLSTKDADEEHPYGHRRFETGATLALGLLLFLVGIGILWSAVHRLESPDSIPRVNAIALWVAAAALITKESLFRYLLSVGKRVQSSMLVANAWHARSDAASSLVVGIGIIGNLIGYPILDPVAALIVASLIMRMGFGFGWKSLYELMDGAADAEEVAAIRQTLLEIPDIRSIHELRTRKMGDLIVVDVHIEVDADLTVEASHDIAVAARELVMQRHRVLDLMTHIDPYRRPDLDHVALGTPAPGNP